MNQAIKQKKGTRVVDILIALAVAIVLGYTIYSTSQWANLRKIAEWRNSIDTEFEQLKQQCPSLSEVKIGSGTGGDGMVFILISKSIDPADELLLYRFILDSKPPRPILYFYQSNLRKQPTWKTQKKEVEQTTVRAEQ